MKSKKTVFILILLFCLCISAYLIIKYLILRPSAYTSEQAIKNGDVVNVLDKTYNFDKLENFIKNVKSHKKDKIRITSYTMEGDAIIKTLNFTGKTIECSVDMRRDKFAGSADRKIKRYKFSQINKESNNNNTVYFLSNNNKSDRMDIFWLNNTPVKANSNNTDNAVTVTTDSNYYTPAMSSKRGLKLIPHFKSDKNYTDLEYHWTTEKGEFIDEGKGEFADLGKEARNSGESTIWSAIENDKIINIQNTFYIKLDVIDKDSNTILASTKVTIFIEDGFYKMKN